MKRISYIIIALLLTTGCLLAQGVPQGMKYQAVARDAKGAVLANQDISLRISLLSSPVKRNTLYEEVHHITANELGLFDLVIGQGLSTTPARFATIPWERGEVWMELAIDATGGEQFTVIGTSQLLSVPYAMHAGTAARLSDGSELEKEGNTGNTWKVGGNVFNVPGPHYLGTLEAVDLEFITDGEVRLTVTAAGDIDIENSLAVGENLDVGGNAAIVGDLDVEGIARFNNMAQSTAPGNGAVIVAGGVGIGKNTNVGGNAEVDGTLGVDGIANLRDDANIAGDANIASDANIGGDSDTDGNANVAGDMTVGGTTSLSGKTSINASVTGDAGTFNNHPLTVEGATNGIGIKVNSTNPHRDVNFVTMFNGSGTALGRIEGFDFAQDNVAIGRSLLDALFDRSNPFGESMSVTQSATGLSTSITNIFNSFNSDYGVGVVSETMGLVSSIIQGIINIAGCTVLIGCDDLAAAAVDIIHSGLQLSLHIFYFGYNEGVAFESGGADYAEWLRKADLDERLAYGEVVGVRGGVISREFTTAEKFMVVSFNPTVIGAMPQVGEEGLFEKIAFMGQVPVKVIGRVSMGDYILPSGNGDGLAIAVTPERMKARDYQRIVGIAWGESDGVKAFNLVNVAVGINTNDLVDVVERMQLVMNDMQRAIQQVNPDFQPHFYELGDDVQLNANAFTVAPTLPELLQQKVNVPAGTDGLAMMQDLKEQARQQGFDVYEYPYLGEIFDNPGDPQLLNEALVYYQEVMTRMQILMAQLDKRN